MTLIKTGEGWNRSDDRREYMLFWQEMFPVVSRVVAASFEDTDAGKMEHITHAEVKERSEWCKRTVDTLRKDKQWSKQRIKDNLAMILRCHLGGIALDLDTLGARTTW